MIKLYKVSLLISISTLLMACVTTTKTEDNSQVSSKTTEKKVESLPKDESKSAVRKAVKIKAISEKSAESNIKTLDGKLVLGAVEWVYVSGLQESFKARVDSGAHTSSLGVVDEVLFERDGHDWVKFKVEDGKKKSKEIALPVKRWVKIKQSNTSEAQRRPVVEAWVQVGSLKDKTDFTLADRKHLSFPVLLGREFLKDVAVVDVGSSYKQGKPK